MLFRKSKVLKILLEYARVYNTIIPENAIGTEELYQLKQVELEHLAIAYDALEGYQYFEEPLEGIDISIRFNMPDRSMFKPSRVLANTMGVGRLSLKVRRLKNLRFLRDNNFLLSGKVPRDSEVFVPVGRSLWKT